MPSSSPLIQVASPHPNAQVLSAALAKCDLGGSVLSPCVERHVITQDSLLLPSCECLLGFLRNFTEISFNHIFITLVSRDINEEIVQCFAFNTRDHTNTRQARKFFMLSAEHNLASSFRCLDVGRSAHRFPPYCLPFLYCLDHLRMIRLSEEICPSVQNTPRILAQVVSNNWHTLTDLRTWPWFLYAQIASAFPYKSGVILGFTRDKYERDGKWHGLTEISVSQFDEPGNDNFIVHFQEQRFSSLFNTLAKSPIRSRVTILHWERYANFLDAKLQSVEKLVAKACRKFPVLEEFHLAFHSSTSFIASEQGNNAIYDEIRDVFKALRTELSNCTCVTSKFEAVKSLAFNQEWRVDRFHLAHTPEGRLKMQKNIVDYASGLFVALWPSSQVVNDALTATMQTTSGPAKVVVRFIF